ncbi:MAG TPA: hypothetical protein VFE62_06340 [Gemmataceae bacterium]|nr:hypothetical protein [Gemmataceae bacterium]
MPVSRKKIIEIREVIRVAKDRFILDVHGIHGVAHWQRVRENGLRIAKHTGADPRLVELFAFLHDCCREDDGADPGHGKRAAEFAQSLRGDALHLDDADFDTLFIAIRDHELGYTRGDVTVITCWDADRLDLGRVWIRPEPRYLCTKHARQEETIRWAYERSQAK